MTRNISLVLLIRFAMDTTLFTVHNRKLIFYKIYNKMIIEIHFLSYVIDCKSFCIIYFSKYR